MIYSTVFRSGFFPLLFFSPFFSGLLRSSLLKPINFQLWLFDFPAFDVSTSDIFTFCVFISRSAFATLRKTIRFWIEIAKLNVATIFHSGKSNECLYVCRYCAPGTWIDMEDIHFNDFGRKERIPGVASKRDENRKWKADDVQRKMNINYKQWQYPGYFGRKINFKRNPLFPLKSSKWT